MNPIQSVAFNNEIALAKEFIAKGELETSFAHIERAHVIGQAFVLPHARSHWLMLKVEFRRRRPVAAIGQIVRLALGILGSAVGVVPFGNTGGSNVSMFESMPIAPELQNIIDGRASASPSISSLLSISLGSCGIRKCMRLQPNMPIKRDASS